MRFLYLILLLLLFNSCNTLEKAIDKVTETETNARVGQEAIHAAYPIVTAEFSERVYPFVQTGEETETEVIPGNSEELKKQLASAEAEADSLLQVLNEIPVTEGCEEDVASREAIIRQMQNRIVALNKQAANLQADIQRTTTTLRKESTAAIEASKIRENELKAQVAVLQEKLADREATIQELQAELEKPNWWKWCLIGMVVLGAGGFGFKFLR